MSVAFHVNLTSFFCVKNEIYETKFVEKIIDINQIQI